MKSILCVFYVATALIVPCSAEKTDEIQAVHGVHQVWKEAFEETDIPTIEKLWSNAQDVRLVTLLGIPHKGWAEVKAALKNMFGLLGKTTLDISDKFITVDGAQAEITMNYRWSPVPPDKVFFLTERYRKEGLGEWKLYFSDSFNKPLPLRPDGEKVIKPLAQKVETALIAKDHAAIADMVTDDFVYTSPDGNQHLGWLKSAPNLADDIDRFDEPKRLLLALIEDQAYGQYLLTRNDGQKSNLLLTFTGPNWKLKAISISKTPESLPVIQPLDKLTTTWAEIKNR